MIWALGNRVSDALAVAARLEAEEGVSAGVVNARFVKPLDRALLLNHAGRIRLLVTMEDHVLAGGFGSAVLEALQEGACREAGGGAYRRWSASAGPTSLSNTAAVRSLCARRTACHPERFTSACSTAGAALVSSSEL